MFRRILIATVSVILVVAAIFLINSESRPAIIVLVFDCTVLLLGLVFERRGYRPKVDATRGIWERTGERFVDPESGVLTDVYYNASTGQRNYLPATQEDR